MERLAGRSNPAAQGNATSCESRVGRLLFGGDVPPSLTLCVMGYLTQKTEWSTDVLEP